MPNQNYFFLWWKSHRKIYLIWLLIFLGACVPERPRTEKKPYPADDNYVLGEKLFAIHCSLCHRLDRDMLGPALQGVGKKYEREWLTAFIRDAPSLIRSGDARAVAVYNQYNKAEMTPFPTLTDVEIMAMLTYLK